MKDKTREAIGKILNGDGLDLGYAFTEQIIDRIEQVLITAQADGVTDEQIKEAAMKYATKPLAPYLRSEVFIDACKWLLSELARREGGGKLPCGCDANGNPVFWNEFNNVVQCHKCGDVYLPSPPKTTE